MRLHDVAAFLTLTPAVVPTRRLPARPRSTGLASSGGDPMEMTLDSEHTLFHLCPPEGKELIVPTLYHFHTKSQPRMSAFTADS